MSDVTSNIKKITNAVGEFLSIYNHETWIKTATVEEIKTAFKLGSFIEKAVEHFSVINCSNDFFELLFNWQKSTKQPYIQNEQFFKLACDELLGKFFRFPNTKDTTLDIAIRIYTSLFSRERLKKCLTQLFLSNSSLQSLMEYTNNNCDQQELEFRIKLNSWSHTMRINSNINDEITSLLSMHNVSSNLQLLLGMASLQDVSEPEKDFQNLVIKNVLETMLDRSILSKSFWLTLIKSVTIKVIITTCENYQDFFDSLLNFIVYAGSMMQEEKVGCTVVWKSDFNITFCPEIDYYSLIYILKKLYEKNEIFKQIVTKRLIEAKEETSLNIWDQILKVIT